MDRIVDIAVFKKIKFSSWFEVRTKLKRGVDHLISNRTIEHTFSMRLQISIRDPILPQVLRGKNPRFLAHRIRVLK